MKEYKIKKGQIVLDIIPFKKGQRYEVVEKLNRKIWNEEEYVYEIQVADFLKGDRMNFKNLTVWYNDNLSYEPSNKEVTYRLIEG